MEKAGHPSRVSPQAEAPHGAITTASGSADAGWPPPIPPWAAPRIWAAATASVDHHLQLRHIGLHRPTRHCARAIAEVMVSLDPPMTALAQATCPDCVDPCCRRATLWYDLADLLAIGFLGLPWPPGQPMRSVGAPCRYLGPGGCRLARLHRPWICTWYLCPRQRSMLNSDLRSEAAAVTSRLAAMKTLRVRLVETFIEASGRA